LSEEGVAKAQRIISLLEEGFRNQKIKKLSTCLLLFLENSGYLKYLAKQESRGESAIMNQLSSLKQFFEFIAAYETASSQMSAVPNLLRHIDFLLEAGDELSLQPTLQEDALRIMTVHASKGLEFKFVFIINAVEERFPLRRRKEAIEIPEFFVREQLPKGDAHYQEERRLFYVALTRAKLKVFITNSEDYGGSRQRKISRFINEAGINNVATEESGTTEKLLEKIKKEGTSFNTQEDAFSISQPVYPTPKAFSFSQLKSYEACPYQYKLAHIVKLPTKGSASFSFGQTMHATLQKFYQRIQEMNSVKQVGLFDKILISETKNISTVKSPSFEELIKIYEESWIDDWYNDKIQKQAYFDKGKKILKELYVSQNDQWNIPVSLEGWFKIKLGDYFLHGRIDRIDQLTDGSLEIIDYKTGTSKQKVVGEEKDQLLIYQIATTQLPQFSLMGKTSKLTFFYLNDNSKVSFLGSSEEIEGLKTKLLENILEIKKGNFSATPNPFTCSFCQFKDICEYRTL
jgi:DNA helicase-2/ATP-dependent DNA helicase PcrA